MDAFWGRMSPSPAVYASCVKPLPALDLDHILSHTSGVWDELRGQRIFLSGATGFFGAWLLESLLHCNHALHLDISATVLCRDPDSYARRMPHVAADAAITLWQGDTRSLEIPEHEYPYVVHAAAPTSVDAADRPLELLSTLVEGTQRMVALAAGHGTRKFLFVSSGAVYGRQPQHISHIPEDYLGGPDWLDPHAAYAEGKRVAEQMCAIQASRTSVEFRIARCFAFVGPHLPFDAHFAIGNFIRDALAGRDIEVQGDGTPMRSYLYAADLAIWLWTMLLRKSPSGTNLDIWNVGSADAISIRDLACTVGEEIRSVGMLYVRGTPDPNAFRQQYVPDVRKAEIELDLRQTIPLREAIRRTADWYR